MKRLAFGSLLVVSGLVSIAWPTESRVPGPDRSTAVSDSDGDGLSDFHEAHKYRTNPKEKHSAGKEASDADWRQRREFTYSVRAIVRVMKPYNIEAMSDDYQDVRVLKETKDDGQG